MAKSKSRRGRVVAAELKEAVLAFLQERDGLNCAFCGGDLLEPPKLEPGWSGKPPKGGVTLDHIVPVSKGGPNRLANLRLLHMSCNVRAYYGPPELDHSKQRRRADRLASYHKWYKEKKEKIQALRREKYRTDVEFRKKRLESGATYRKQHRSDEAFRRKHREYMAAWSNRRKTSGLGQN